MLRVVSFMPSPIICTQQSCRFQVGIGLRESLGIQYLADMAVDVALLLLGNARPISVEKQGALLPGWQPLTQADRCQLAVDIELEHRALSRSTTFR